MNQRFWGCFDPALEVPLVSDFFFNDTITLIHGEWARVRPVAREGFWFSLHFVTCSSFDLRAVLRGSSCGCVIYQNLRLGLTLTRARDEVEGTWRNWSLFKHASAETVMWWRLSTSSECEAYDLPFNQVHHLPLRRDPIRGHPSLLFSTDEGPFPSQALRWHWCWHKTGKVTK